MDGNIRIIIHAIKLLDNRDIEGASKLLKQEISMMQKRLLLDVLETKDITGDQEVIESLKDTIGMIESQQ